MSGDAVCYVSVMESADMLAEATKAAMKKAKALGVAGPFSPLDLRDLTEPVSDEVTFISYAYIHIMHRLGLVSKKFSKKKTRGLFSHDPIGELTRPNLVCMYVCMNVRLSGRKKKDFFHRAKNNAFF